jgi:arylsulfatase A-like enzyme
MMSEGLQKAREKTVKAGAERIVMFTDSVLRRFSFLLVVISILLGCSVRAETRPNVIVILVDDIGVGDFGFSGGKDFPTPNIDRLAREGVTFSNGYAMPSCSPTRAALLTGRYPQRFGIEDNRPLDGPNDGMDLSQVTLPMRLKTAGYATSLIGKWHLGRGRNFEFAPRNRGFDEFFGYFGAAGQYVDPVLSRNGVEKKYEGYNTDLLTDEACNYLRAHQETPFFLHLAYMAAHLPQVARPQDLARVPHLSGVRQRGAAIIVNLDDNIGRLLDTLKQTKMDERTLLFFLSDNGAEPALLGTTNGPHRGQKFDVLEGGIRVPFALRWPGVVPAGKTYAPMVHVFDIFSTTLSAAGVGIPDGIDGVDVLPYVLGKKAGVPHRQLCWLYNDHKEWRIPGRDTNLARPLRALREENVKLLIEGDNAPEFYDLDADPGEASNLAAQQAERLQRLRQDYERWKGQMKPQIISDTHPLYGHYKTMNADSDKQTNKKEKKP